MGHNSLESKAQPFLKRVEDFHDELDSLRGSYMASCRGVRERIKTVYTEAKDAGVAPRPLKGLVKHRALLRKQEKIRVSFDDVDEAAVFAELVDKLGPLGAAAAARRGFTDLVRPTIDEGDRVAKAGGNGNLDTLGRGPVADVRPIA